MILILIIEVINILIILLLITGNFSLNGKSHIGGNPLRRVALAFTPIFINQIVNQNKAI